jgi:hypothetical protein
MLTTQISSDNLPNYSVIWGLKPKCPRVSFNPSLKAGVKKNPDFKETQIQGLLILFFLPKFFKK